MSGCFGMLRPSAFTWCWQKAKNSFSFWGKRALCSKKVCVVKFSQKGTFFLSDHFCHKSMMMMVFWPHICNCLAYMASLAKKYFWSNVLNRSLFIAEGGTYAKMIYVEKIILCDVFQKWSKKFKFSRNQKHHKKRLKKTLVVMFSDFWLLTIFKSPLKNITNNIFFVHKILNITWIFTLFWQCFILYV